MKKYTLAAILGGAMLAVVPASASSTTFNFTSGTNNSNMSSYSVTNGITVTAVAVYAEGTSSGPNTGTSGDFQTGEVGEYNGAGMGVCESQTGDNCASPNHQINNGADTTLSGGNGSGPDAFEFVLFQFVNANVNLSQITLGNFGTTGSSSDPFLATYFVSNSTDSLSQMQAALSATTVGGLANTNGFGTAVQTTCSGTCTVNATGVNETIAGNGTTYLLFGASTASANVGNEFFKVQDLTVSSYNTVTSTPEPSTFGLIGLALTGIGIAIRKSRSNRS